MPVVTLQYRTSCNHSRRFTMPCLRLFWYYLIPVVMCSFKYNVNQAKISNATELLYQYYLLCGPEYFCHPEKFGFGFDSIKTRHTKVCPDCTCDPICTQRGDCCADVIFSVPLPVCLMPSLPNSFLNLEQRKVYMINACPNDTENEALQGKCKTNNIVFMTDHIEFPPVTSRRYKQTFKNKFCAECNDVYDYVAWSLSMDCQTLIDFNFFSTFDDIIDKAEKDGCNIGFDTVADDVLECKVDFVDEIFFSDCNKTGTWTTYNSDIELACNSEYRVTSSVYRNVYCSMCNPPMSNGDVISSCNVTGLWDENVEHIEQACRTHALSLNTVPYKNVFCFLCNRNSSHSSPYYDVYVDNMSEKLYIMNTLGSEGYVHRYVFTFIEYNLGFYNTIIARDGRAVNPTTEYSVAMNLSKLLQYDFSVTGYYRYCRQDVVPYTFGKYNCSCDSRCVFDPMTECCLDIVLKSSISCQMPYLATDGPSYYFIDSCSQSESPDSIQSRCRSPSEDIYSTLSVVGEDNKPYNNFDCFLCNQNFETFSTQHLSQSKYHPWSISVQCVGDLNIRFHSTIYSIIAMATRIGCIIDVSTDHVNRYETCERPGFLGPPYIYQCNTTGYWTEYDSDIVWSCEQSSLVNPFEKYRNVFCFLCNPSVQTISEPIQNCTNDGGSLHAAQFSHACHELPEVISMFPMKNVFCHYCNSNGSDIPLPRRIMFEMYNAHNSKVMSREPDINSIFRNLFRPIATTIVKEGRELNDTHLFDPITTRHRQLTCYPGKVLNGTECRPLLRTTTNLKYTLALSLEGTIPSVNQTNMVLANIRNAVYSEMTTRFDIGFTMVMFRFTSNVSCEIGNVTLPIAAHLLIQTTVTMTEVVERLNIERILLNMSKDDLEISDVMFRPRPASEAYILPSVLGFNFGGYCVKSMFFNTKALSALLGFRTTLVSDVMICRQVTLDAGEFSINLVTLELYVKYTSKKFKQDRFVRMPDGKVRLCLDDYLAIINEHGTSIENNNTMEDALYITTMVCTVISLICLFLTFCTYLFFRTMRSIPGVTNMSLVFAMFFSQGFFHVGFNQTSVVPVCIAMGMVTHYFWLATFTCMNVCSYHMYSVFGTNMLLGRSNNKRKTLAIYFSYSYGIPALFVLANLITSYCMSLSDDVTSVLTTLGYGGRVCFISKSVSIYATFFAPVVLICVLNMFMFTKVAIQMKALPEVESTKARKHDFVIYLKLFSITGITWILVIIDTFLPLSVYSFIVCILNGCQGLFIFLSFVCSQNVFSLYKKMCCKIERRQASSIDFSGTCVEGMSSSI